MLHTKNFSLKLKTLFRHDIPKPHKFSAEFSLISSIAEVAEITAKVNDLLPQFANFIHQFNNLIISNNANVIIDTAGNMILDIPDNMPNVDAGNLRQRMGIIDRLILTRGQEIDQLLQRGLSIEADLKRENANYTSQILDKVNEFRKLNNSYR